MEVQSSMSKLTPKEKVDYFRAVVDKTQLESRDEGQTYTAEEAVLGVETLLNYDYDDFTKRYNNSDVKKDTITISKNNGVIDDNVIADLNDAVLGIMQCHFANIDSTNKKEMFVDLYNVSENSQEFQVGVTNVVGFFPTVIWPNTATFGPGDDWKANFGKCDGTHPESNAPKKIASYATWNVGINYLTPEVWFSDYEYKNYYFEDQSSWFAINPNDPIPGDFVIDYFEWQFDGCDEFYNENDDEYDKCWDTEPEMPMRIETEEGFVRNPDVDDAFCIDYPEMNYYRANAESEALKFVPVLNKEFIYMQMDFDGNLSIPYTYTYWWWGEGTYAKKNIDITRGPKLLSSCK